jgi:hypothetical protein
MTEATHFMVSPFSLALPTIGAASRPTDGVVCSHHRAAATAMTNDMPMHLRTIAISGQGLIARWRRDGGAVQGAALAAA